MALTPRHQGRSGLMFFGFRCRLWCEHRTDVNTQLSKVKRPLPLIPRPEGRFRANGSHPAVAADTLIEGFVEVGFGFEPFQFLLGTSFHPRPLNRHDLLMLADLGGRRK